MPLWMMGLRRRELWRVFSRFNRWRWSFEGVKVWKMLCSNTE